MKKQLCLIALEIILTALFIASIAYLLRANKTYAIYAPLTKSKISSETDPFKGYPILRRIAACESTGDANKEPREFGDDGTVLRGYPNPDDIGLGQINLPTWGSKAKEMGFDLWTYHGNLEMTKWIYSHYGNKPWIYSKNCWKNDI